MFNFYIDKASFPNSLKQADITPVHKKMTQMIKTTIDQSAYYLLCLRLSKSVCMIKFMLTLIVFFLRPNAALEKATVLSIQLLQWLKNGHAIWIEVAYVEILKCKLEYLKWTFISEFRFYISFWILTLGFQIWFHFFKFI